MKTSRIVTLSGCLDAWVPYRDDSGVRFRILCFPHAGGTALAYRSWRASAAPRLDFCPIELPGRATRISEPPFRSMADLIENLSETLQPLLQVPFAFFGHSVGAVVALEAARRIRARDGKSAVHLFVSGRATPEPVPPDRHLHRLPDGALLAELGRLGGTPAAVLEHRQLMSALLPAIRADLALVETRDASPVGRLACPITAFAGVDDPSVGSGELDGWREVTDGIFRLFWLPGGHFHTPATAAAVVREMTRRMPSEPVRPGRPGG